MQIVIDDSILDGPSSESESGGESENNSERERAYCESEEDDNEPYIKSTYNGSINYILQLY